MTKKLFINSKTRSFISKLLWNFITVFQIEFKNTDGRAFGESIFVENFFELKAVMDTLKKWETVS